MYELIKLTLVFQAIFWLEKLLEFVHFYRLLNNSHADTLIDPAVVSTQITQF